ncbi:MAG: hypothetical protein A3J28_11725 [Acidobacteria bacterium RIFCSPLOWO2_12_FULL_60_22]|nr:MAG: hypothetical protein A3J28_11725 [Acidobacteria bacterium RIFCSPLOWO2_12_FULL_60_22]
MADLGDTEPSVIDLGPDQKPITEDLICEMVSWTPRRVKLASDSFWPNVLQQPSGDYRNWLLVLPFPETFQNAFETMCFDVTHRVHVAENNRCCIFLNDSHSDGGKSVNRAKAWIKTVGQHIAIRDRLALSFALDYRMESGDPQKKKTVVGDLCRRAKLYEGSTSHDREAAKQLAQLCMDSLQKLTCYDSADCVVAMPSSRLKKTFDLPSYLAGKIASATGKKNLCDAVRTVKQRKQLKGLPVDEKLDALKGTVRVDGNAFQGKTVLIVDDLYQSGISLNYVAMLLLEAGARKVFGLACEKTSTNDDNIP